MAPVLPSFVLEILGDLRCAALTCRAAARADVFKACALLATAKNEARAVFAEATVRCLEQALGKTPVIFRPGVTELSFDEAWITSALRAAQSEDEASLTFLIHTRIPFEHRRNIGFLIRSLVRDRSI